MGSSNYAREGKLKPKVTFLPVPGEDAIAFHSLLEARWAVTFEMLHLQWEYEPITFERFGTWRYTPDFYLKDIGWIEIKPDLDKLKADEAKLRRFVQYRHELVPEGYATRFFSISADAPTFAFGPRAPGYLIEWVDGGYIDHDKTIAIDTFCSPKARQLKAENREHYIDHVDRIVSHTKDLYFDGPYHAGSLSVLQLSEWATGDSRAFFKWTSSLPDGGE